MTNNKPRTMPDDIRDAAAQRFAHNVGMLADEFLKEQEAEDRDRRRATAAESTRQEPRHV
ncbi:hypothetical protein AB5J62_05290 [Amycolatopsis sp. cg5]|uniref:hypothetical protein n=1 Tax=Amycolatopsis sp. cg5 TaxID=3238802 RepID=UPI003523A82F